MNPVKEGTLLRAVLDASVNAIIVSDAEGRILRLNAAALFGYGIDESINVRMPAAVAAGHDGYMHHHIASGETNVIGHGRGDTGVRADGSNFSIHLSVGRTEV